MTGYETECLHHYHADAANDVWTQQLYLIEA